MEESKCQPVSLCLFHPLPLCLGTCFCVCVCVCECVSLCVCVCICVFGLDFGLLVVGLPSNTLCNLEQKRAIRKCSYLLLGRQSSFVQLVSNGFCFESTSSFKSNLKQNSQIVMSCGLEPKTGCVSARIYSWLQETPPLTSLLFLCFVSQDLRAVLH